MQIIDNSALNFTVPSDIGNDIVRTIDRSELLTGNLNWKNLLVYWDYSESAQLAYYIDRAQPREDLPSIPSPILRDYHWPGIHRPFEHQKTTAAFLSLRKRAFCFNEAGTGKTAASIWAADYLMNLGHIKHALIICPMTIMYTAWQADIFKTTMHRSAAVAHGPREKRVKVINDKYDFTIINYDGINVVRDEIIAAKYDLIIIDEANAYKAVNTRRWKTMAKIVTPDTYLWLMTGTPAAQSPMDAFGLARLAAPDRVPKYVGAWRDRVMMQVSRFKWVPRHNSKKFVFQALQPAIRFTKDQCLDLPSVMYQTRDVPLTPQATAYYKRLKSQMLIEAAGEQISAVNAAASLSKLLQISGGSVYSDAHEVVDFDVSPRLAAFKEVLDETVNKVVVFVPYLHTIQTVADFLKANGISSEIIHGGVTAKARAEIIGRFQNSVDPRVLVIQPQAASHGVTLTAADTVVFWSPVMSVETYLQCIARIDRVGQKNKMTVVHLQGSDVERKVYAMLQGKVDSHQKLVDLYKSELGLNEV